MKLCTNFGSETQLKHEGNIKHRNMYILFKMNNPFGNSKFPAIFFIFIQIQFVVAYYLAVRVGSAVHPKYQSIFSVFGIQTKSLAQKLFNFCDAASNPAIG